MLNGHNEAIENEFGTSHTIVRPSASKPKVRRDIFTRNQTIIDQVFEHAEQTFHAYCNFPPGSEECQAVFEGGADDTIIGLPDHFGEGPFARVVSMQPVASHYELPKHHVTHRSLNGLQDNPIYHIKIDYAFHLVRQDRGPVQIRVDYTNLLGYWSKLTDSKASKRSRVARGLKEEDEFTMRHFREQAQHGEKVEKHLRKQPG
jgi:hypothetical protein